MPRPGPRPYECVRRAWHSDRHQPMRGSIIQQIFRVVNEVHGSGTKKNKEWQEKLPVVVLKAEEIMYSKANSEAEYMNLETLWDRVNDAVNTVIRRDEGTETGELLPPCVEAALNLGCIPVRASRSQRHINPRSYLTPRTLEPASAPARILDRTAGERRPQFSPHNPGNQLNFAKPSAVNSAHSIPDSFSWINQSTNLTSPRNYPFSLMNVPAGHNQLTTMSTNNPLDLGSVYPLYYGIHCQSEECQAGPRAPENTHSRTIYVGKPVVTSIVEPSKQNIFSSQSAEDVSHRTTQVMDTQEKARETEFDLSLRLGPVLHPCTQRSLANETEDFSSSGSQERGKLNDLSPSINNEICFFPTKTAYDRFDSTSSMWNSEGEGRCLEATVRKRKAPFSSNEEDGRFCWQPSVLPKRFTGRTTRPGL